MSLLNQQTQDELIDQLLRLTYHAYLQVVALLLEKMGYEQVRLADRTDFMGRNADGGVDLRAYRSNYEGRRLVIFQVKQYTPERLVYRNTLDQVRGVALRERAAEGVIITTSDFTSAISR